MTKYAKCISSCLIPAVGFGHSAWPRQCHTQNRTEPHALGSFSYNTLSLLIMFTNAHEDTSERTNMSQFVASATNGVRVRL